MPGNSETRIVGAAFVALVALYTVLKRPGVFGRLLPESPSCYVSDGRIFEAARGVRVWPRRIYVGVGTNEGGRAGCEPGDLGQEAVRDVLRLKREVEAAGPRDGRLKVVVGECATHDEGAWAKRLPEALTFLYAANQSCGRLGRGFSSAKAFAPARVQTPGLQTRRRVRGGSAGRV